MRGKSFGTAGPAWILAVAALVAAGCSDAGGGSAYPATGPRTSATAGVPAPPGPASPGPAPEGPATAIPADLRLPNEGERSDAAEFTDWTTDNSSGQPWLLDPCRPTSYPTDAQRVAFRTVSRTGPEARDARQLAIYPSPEIAAEAVAGFRRALTACRTGGSPAAGNAWQWASEDLPSVGDEGFLAAVTVGGPGYSAVGQRIAVTRAGSKVFLAYGEGEYSTAEIDEGARNEQRVAEEFVATI